MSGFRKSCPHCGIEKCTSHSYAAHIAACPRNPNNWRSRKMDIESRVEKAARDCADQIAADGFDEYGRMSAFKIKEIVRLAMIRIRQ